MRVLIVDDELSVRELLTTAIDMVGYDRLDTAENGEKALALSMENRYDLVTLDIRMPGISGLETLPVMRHAMPRAVIAIISAYTGDASEMDTSDADLILKKPFHLKAVQHLAQLAKDLAKTQAAIHALSDTAQTTFF